MKLYTVIVAVLLVGIVAVRSEPDIPPGSVGPIINVDAKTPSGTGFCSEDPNTVVTCAHVIRPDSRYVFLDLREREKVKGVPLVPVLAFPKHDLILLKTPEPLTEKVTSQ